MKTNTSNKYCRDFVPVQNTYFSANYDNISANVAKSYQCKNCAYFTSRNCTNLTSKEKNYFYNNVDFMC